MPHAVGPAMLVALTTALTIFACGGGLDRQQRADRASVRVLPCQQTIGAEPPDPDMSVVLGVVGLPASPRMRRGLQTARTGSHDRATRLFAKWGLVVRAGAEFQLTVPREHRGDATIGWGNAGEGHVGGTIAVHRCRGQPGYEWLDFAGGYWVRRPICLRLTVTAHGQKREVRIGVGRGCPGQLPPLQPTES